MPDDVKSETTDAAVTNTTAPSGAVSDSVVVDTKAETKVEGKTTLASGGEVTKEAAVPVNFPDDWREKIAGENKDDLKTLSRYTSPEAMWSALKSMRAKMSAGELKAITEFPADGDDKAKAEWRKQNGLPEAAEQYEPKIEGLVFGDSDKPMLESFQKHAFENKWSPAQFNQGLAWYAAEQDAMRVRQDQMDTKFQQEAKDKLYTEWGPQDYHRNINSIKTLFDAAPSGFMDRVFSARMSDGRIAGDDPEVLKFFAQVAREMNPAATLIPAGVEPSKGLSARKAEIDKLISDRGSDYYRGSNANALQTEYRQILEAEERMKSRAA